MLAQEDYQIFQTYKGKIIYSRNRGAATAARLVVQAGRQAGRPDQAGPGRLGHPVVGAVGQLIDASTNMNA